MTDLNPVKRALILVDPQEDFFPDGALGVPDSWWIVAVINALLEWSAKTGYYDVVVLTGDWHPAEHRMFACNNPGSKPFDVVGGETLWPAHCGQNTKGAQFFGGRAEVPARDGAVGWVEMVPALKTEYANLIVRKGMNPGSHPFSAFCDNDGSNPTGLDGFLSGRGITDVDVCGQTLPYCPSYTAIHSHKAGFRTRIIEDGCSTLHVTPTAVQDDLDAMQARGIGIVQSKLVMSGWQDRAEREIARIDLEAAQA